MNTHSNSYSKKSPKLLTRDQFREGVFDRDNHKCIICGEPAKDAHHIIERRLWPDGGYYLDNGASLCEAHHIQAEQTVLSVEEVREAAGIEHPILPPHFYPEETLDKWGNTVLPSGMRTRGELFDDPSVQKILGSGGVLDRFTKHVKYPRTWHLPWSPGGENKDERTLKSVEQFEGKDIVVFLKVDGENTTFYSDYIHARSLDYGPHPSRDWVKSLWGRTAYQIPDGWRVCGENMYAKHSIHYKNLPDYFFVFSIWNEKNEILDWDATREWVELLGYSMCPVLYEGPWDEDLVRQLHRDQDIWGNEVEGYVVRIQDSFHYRDFRLYNGKYVRPNHVQTHAFWRTQKVVPNELAEGVDPFANH